MVWSPSTRRGTAVAIALLVALAVLPGAAAAAETRSGGTVVVEEGETVDGLRAFGGTVIVQGTVDGDLEAFAGNVFVEGEVTGDVETAAGNVRIAGPVGGSVEVAGGNVFVERDATIGGNLEAAGGNVVVAGTVRGDAKLAGGSVTLASTATVDGTVEYAVGDEGEFQNAGATVGGSIVERDDLDVGGPVRGPDVPPWAFDLYGALVTLALGAVLLVALPGFSGRVAQRVAEEPLRTGGLGLLALVGVPVVLVALAITIVGIPIAFVGALLFAFLAWIAAVYGRFAVGSWVAVRAGNDSRWVALAVGVLGVFVVKRLLALVPPLGWLGGLVELAVVLLGLGALTALSREAYRRRRGPDADAAPT